MEGGAAMFATTLKETALALVAPGKGILAADESHATIGRRFEALGIPNSEEQRRRYRQMLFTTKGIGEFISGVILFDETIRQAADGGRPFGEVLAGEGIIPGIKVDRGAKPLARTAALRRGWAWRPTRTPSRATPRCARKRRSSRSSSRRS